MQSLGATEQKETSHRGEAPWKESGNERVEGGGGEKGNGGRQCYSMPFRFTCLMRVSRIKVNVQDERCQPKGPATCSVSTHQ